IVVVRLSNEAEHSPEIRLNGFYSAEQRPMSRGALAGPQGPRRSLLTAASRLWWKWSSMAGSSLMLRSAVIAGLVWMVSVAPALAQSGSTGAVTGTVRDQTGAA